MYVILLADNNVTKVAVQQSLDVRRAAADYAIKLNKQQNIPSASGVLAAVPTSSELTSKVEIRLGRGSVFEEQFAAGMYFVVDVGRLKLMRIAVADGWIGKYKTIVDAGVFHFIEVVPMAPAASATTSQPNDISKASVDNEPASAPTQLSAAALSVENAVMKVKLEEAESKIRVQANILTRCRDEIARLQNLVDRWGAARSFANRGGRSQPNNYNAS
ncbi:MAG: hypothetical protein WDA28_13145 [Castellaniella sp.]